MTMGPEKPSAAARIILAAIECIEEHGVHRTTIRRIADRAGVNSAAISYYFRSKKRVIELALEQALNNAFDWGDFSYSNDAPAAERLYAILDHLMVGALRYPNISRALNHATLLEGRYDTPCMHRMRQFLTEIVEDLSGRGVTSNRVRLSLAVVQICAASFLYAGTMPHTTDDLLAGSLDDPEVRERYLKTLIQGLLPTS